MRSGRWLSWTRQNGMDKEEAQKVLSTSSNEDIPGYGWCYGETCLMKTKDAVRRHVWALLEERGVTRFFRSCGENTQFYRSGKLRPDPLPVSSLEGSQDHQSKSELPPEGYPPKSPRGGKNDLYGSPSTAHPKGICSHILPPEKIDAIPVLKARRRRS